MVWAGERGARRRGKGCGATRSLGGVSGAGGEAASGGVEQRGEEKGVGRGGLGSPHERGGVVGAGGA